jgi:transketolase
LRAIPGLTVLRPGDANETRCAWQAAIENRGAPTVLVLSRQAMPTLDRAVLAPAEGLRRGAYVLNPAVSDPDLILIASGSELGLIVGAEPILRERGRRVRLVSMPSWELFERQSAEYRRSVLLPAVKARLAVEAACSFGWERWVGDEGAVLCVDRFGMSAPGDVVMKEYGFTVESVVTRALALGGAGDDEA